MTCSLKSTIISWGQEQPIPWQRAEQMPRPWVWSPWHPKKLAWLEPIGWEMSGKRVGGACHEVCRLQQELGIYFYSNGSSPWFKRESDMIWSICSHSFSRPHAQPRYASRITKFSLNLKQVWNDFQTRHSNSLTLPHIHSINLVSCFRSRHTGSHPLLSWHRLAEILKFEILLLTSPVLTLPFCRWAPTASGYLLAALPCWLESCAPRDGFFPPDLQRGHLEGHR